MKDAKELATRAAEELAAEYLSLTGDHWRRGIIQIIEKAITEAQADALRHAANICRGALPGVNPILLVEAFLHDARAVEDRLKPTPVIHPRHG